MDYLNSAEIIQAPQELLQDNFHNLFIINIPGFDEVYDWPSITILHDHLILVFPLENFIQLNDVWMIHLLQELQLGKHFIFFVLKVLFFDNFNSSDFLRIKTISLKNTTVWALAYFFVKTIVLVYIFLPQVYELFLPNLNLPKTVHVLFSHHKVF